MPSHPVNFGCHRLTGTAGNGRPRRLSFVSKRFWRAHHRRTSVCRVPQNPSATGGREPSTPIHQAHQEPNPACFGTITTQPRISPQEVSTRPSACGPNTRESKELRACWRERMANEPPSLPPRTLPRACIPEVRHACLPGVGPNAPEPQNRPKPKTGPSARHGRRPLPLRGRPRHPRL